MFDSFMVSPYGSGDGEVTMPVRIGDILNDTYARIVDPAARRYQPGIPTGFTNLDNLLTGMHGGELIVVGARPSMGKTSFALSIVSHVAMREGKTVALFCPDMPREQVAMRLLCSAARVDLQKVRSGNLTGEMREALANALPAVSSAPVRIDDTPGLTPEMLEDRCRRLKAEDRLDLIVIDYLGLIRADEETGNRNRETATICRKLKTIARELDVPVLLCTQVARPGNGMTGRRPVMSDLRDGGALEQTADVILFLYRADYYDIRPKKQQTCEVMIMKHRNGPLGTIILTWLQECATFTDLSAE